eukprot:368363_1
MSVAFKLLVTTAALFVVGIMIYNLTKKRLNSSKIKIHSPKEVDKRNKLLIAGIFKKWQNILSQHTNNPYYYHIPKGLLSICASYYSIYEHFEIISPFLWTSHDKLTVSDLSVSKYWNNHCYGHEAITLKDNCIARWYIKIVKINFNIFIGISSGKHIVHNHSMNGYFVWKSDDYVYGFFGKTAIAIHKEGTNASVSRNYGRSLQSDDILCMELDLNSRTVKYMLNGNDLDVAFDHIVIDKYMKYKLVICLGHCKDAITLLKFECDESNTLNE